MRFKLGYVAGCATGYYLGAKAGRQRYDQINRTLRKLRTSEVVEKAAGKAKETVQHVLPHRSNGHAHGDPVGDPVVVASTVAGPPTAPLASPYSSSR